MNQRQTDQSTLKVTREIPLPWLIGIVFFGIVQCVTVVLGLQSQKESIMEITSDMKELRTAAAAGGLKSVEFDLKLSDHERRLQSLERKNAQ